MKLKQIFTIIILYLAVFTQAYGWKKSWLNVCPTNMNGYQVYGKYKVNSGPYISEEVLIKVLNRCMGMNACGIANPGNDFDCTVSKRWRSVGWSGHVYVYHDTNGSYQCYSAQWKSGGYYQC